MILVKAGVCLDDGALYAPAAATVTGAGHFQAHNLIGYCFRVLRLDGPHLGAYSDSSQLLDALAMDGMGIYRDPGQPPVAEGT